MNIKVLRQRKIDALNKAKSIMAATETRELTDAERTEYDAVMASVDTLNADIARAEKLMDEDRHAPPVHVSTHNNQEDKPWNSMAEFLSAVRTTAMSNGRNSDARLFAGGQGMNEAVDAEGGFLVPTEMAPGLWKRTYETGIITSRCFHMPMSSLTLGMNAVDEDSRANGSRWGGIQVFRINEGSAYQPSKPKFRRIQFSAKKLTALAYLTEELLADAPATEAYLNEAIPQEFAFKLDNEVLNGSGSDEMLGINNSTALVVVPKDAGQAANTITTSNILNMWARLYAPSRSNAVWLINQAIEPTLFPLVLPGASGGAATIMMYTPPGYGPNPAPYAQLLGRPVIPIEQAPGLSSQGDMMLADFSQYTIAERSGMRADSSMHVAFLTGEMAFRWMLRNDGQPMWKKPLTPLTGPTLSPFVVLQAR